MSITKEYNPYWFRPLLIKWIIYISLMLSVLMIILAIFTNASYLMYAETVGLVSFIPLILVKIKKPDYASYFLLLSYCILTFFRSWQIQSAYNACFLALFIIGASIFTNKRFTFFIFFISVGFIIIAVAAGRFTLGQVQDPTTMLFFANTTSVLIPFIIFAFAIGIIIEQVFYGTIKVQNQQYQLLQQTQDRLINQERIQSIQILAGGIAHDFNNILTAILGNLDLIVTDTNISGEIKEYAQESIEAALRAKNLTNQLLTYAKNKRSTRRVEAINGLIENTTKFSLRGSKSKPKFNIAPDLWNIFVDKEQIGQVIQNLVINADQAMVSGGIIEINVSNIILTQNDSETIPLSPGRYIKCEITDTGVGIPSAFQPQIFKPFYTTKPNGTGLGLSICHSIITNHNGYISFKSIEGKGTTFFFYLPASDEAIQISNEEFRLKEHLTGTVLILDDDIQVQRTLSAMLTKIGFKVEITNDGKDTIQSVKKMLDRGQNYEFVIMDLTIPGGLGGKQIIKELKSLDPSLYTIISSGYSNDDLFGDIQSYGFDDILYKPYQLQDLIQILTKIKVSK